MNLPVIEPRAEKRRPPSSITVEIFPSQTVAQSRRAHKAWLTGLAAVALCFLSLLVLGSEAAEKAVPLETELVTSLSPEKRTQVAQMSSSPQPVPALPRRTEDQSVTPVVSQSQIAASPQPELKVQTVRAKRPKPSLSVGEEAYPKAKPPVALPSEELRPFGPALVYIEPEKATPKATDPNLPVQAPPSEEPQVPVQVLVQAPGEQGSAEPLTASTDQVSSPKAESESSTFTTLPSESGQNTATAPPAATFEAQPLPSASSSPATNQSTVTTAAPPPSTAQAPPTAGPETSTVAATQTRRSGDQGNRGNSGSSVARSPRNDGGGGGQRGGGDGRR